MVEGPVDPKATGRVESILSVKPGGTKTDGHSSDMSSPLGPAQRMFSCASWCINIHREAEKARRWDPLGMTQQGCTCRIDCL